MPDQDCHAAGADLVGDVAVDSHSVASHEAGVHPAVLHLQVGDDCRIP